MSLNLTREYLKQCIEKGLSLYHVANEIGYSYNSVREYIRKNKIIYNKVIFDNNPFISFLNECEELINVLKSKIRREDYEILIAIYLSKPNSKLYDVLKFEREYKINIR